MAKKKYSSMAAFFSLFKAIDDTNQSLSESKLGGLKPFFVGLLSLAVLLYLLHVISPLAPFVYSLF